MEDAEDAEVLYASQKHAGRILPPNQNELFIFHKVKPVMYCNYIYILKIFFLLYYLKDLIF